MKTWLLDLDNTLYKAQSGLFERVNQRIISFMDEHVGLPTEEITVLRESYRERYGSTLGGLMAHHEVSPDDYLPYVHDIELDDLIAPDKELGAILRSLPGRRTIFTNGSTVHAERVLARLGVRDSVGEIFDIAFMDYIPKPRHHGYVKTLKALDVAAAECILVDDLPENLDTGKELGMVTVLVGDSPYKLPSHNKNQSNTNNHIHLDTVHELAKLAGEMKL
jgi:putative hydrolase of the HAD superfamily